jgi:hemerythrin
MRTGLHRFDEERKELVSIVERLDLSPLHTITSDSFLVEFRNCEAAVKAFCKHEEELFSEFQVPDHIRKVHMADHDRILELLNAVKEDSINRRNQTAIDVYQMIRNKIREHIYKFDQELCKFIP